LRFGHPSSISRYACSETVERDFGRDFPARLRRLMFSTSDFFGRDFFALARFDARFFVAISISVSS